MQFDKNGNKEYGDKEFLMNQIALLKSDSLAENIIQTQNLEFDVYFTERRPSVTDVLNEIKITDVLSNFKDNLFINLIPDSNLIKLRFEHSDPAKAAEITNNLIHTFYASDLLETAKLSFERAKQDLELYTDNPQNYNSIENIKETSEYIFLERQLESKRESYDLINLRLNDISFTKDSSSISVKVIDIAKPARFPFKPKKTQKAIISIIFGLVIGIAIASYIMQVDDRIKEPEDINSKLNKFFTQSPTLSQNDNPNSNLLGTQHDATNTIVYSGTYLLGVIPVGQNEDLLDELKYPTSAIAEAYASLRTNIQFSRYDREEPHIIQVTSSASGEGKSTTAIGLAFRYAGAGLKTLVIDADMRRPTFAVVGESIGLSGLLSCSDEIEKHIIETKIDNLFLLPSGNSIPNPSALLSHSRFDQIINFARSNYDNVIIDSPPVLGIADAPIIGAKVDTTVFIVESNRMRTHNIKAAIERLQFTKSRLLGIVLTRYKGQKGFSHQYSYSYGPSYSYTKQNKKLDKEKIRLD